MRPKHPKPKTAKARLKLKAPVRSDLPRIRTTPLARKDLSALEETVENHMANLPQKHTAMLFTLLWVVELQESARADVSNRTAIDKYAVDRKQRYRDYFKDWGRMLHQFEMSWENVFGGSQAPYTTRLELVLLAKTVRAYLDKGLQDYGLPFLFRHDVQLYAQFGQAERREIIPSISAINLTKSSKGFAGEEYKKAVEQHNRLAAQLNRLLPTEQGNRYEDTEVVGEGGQGQLVPGTTDKPEKPRRIDNRKGDRHKTPRNRNLHQELKKKGQEPLLVYLEAALLTRIKKTAKERGEPLKQMVAESLERTVREHENSRVTENPTRPTGTAPTATTVRRTSPKI